MVAARVAQAALGQLLLMLVESGMLRCANGAALRGSTLGSSLVQVETKSGAKVTIDTSEEFQDLQDTADDPAGGILAVSDERGEPEGPASEGGEPQTAQLERVGRMVDANRDARISHEELKSFAQRLRDRQRHEQTGAALQLVDADGRDGVDLAEVQAVWRNASSELLRHHAQRFEAADADQDGRLDYAEFHAFVHPELDEKVLAAEVDRQMAVFDRNRDRFIDFQEFKQQGQMQGEDFSADVALEDFQLHDHDGDGRLSHLEFGRMLSGNDLLQENIRKAIEAGDTDGDGFIHLDSELPERLHHLLESEFVEDYFFHKHAETPGIHPEL